MFVSLSSFNTRGIPINRRVLYFSVTTYTIIEYVDGISAEENNTPALKTMMCSRTRLHDRLGLRYEFIKTKGGLTMHEAMKYRSNLVGLKPTKISS